MMSSPKDNKNAHILVQILSGEYTTHEDFLKSVFLSSLKFRMLSSFADPWQNGRDPVRTSNADPGREAQKHTDPTDSEHW